MNNTKRFTVVITNELAEKLEKLAKSNMMSKNDVFELALLELLTKKDQEK